jgi:hypothetical protein
MCSDRSLSFLLFTGATEAHTANGVDMPIAQHITHITSELEVFFVMHILIFSNQVNLKLETMMSYAYHLMDDHG